MIKIVPDTNIFVSSIFWEKGKPHKIIEKVINREIEAFTSREILEELKKILERDFEEPLEMIEEQILLIESYANVIEVLEIIDIVKEDSADNKIIECAVQANVDYIVTGDNHLLKIKNFQNIKIVSPNDFLVEVFRDFE